MYKNAHVFPLQARLYGVLQLLLLVMGSVVALFNVLVILATVNKEE